MYIKFSLAGLLLACSSFLYANTSEQHTRPFPEKIAQELTQLTRDYREQHDIPAVLVGIWTGSGASLIMEEGYSNLNPLVLAQKTDHTRIASITKTFTVMAALKLVQEDQLQLDTPVSKFFPELQNSNATIAELADMTSGIYNYTEAEEFKEKFGRDHKKPGDPMDYLKIGDHNKPYFPSGSDWHYSNTNTLLLGFIIEKVTHQKLATVISEQILRPLGMHQTFYPDTLQMPIPYLHGYISKPYEDVTITDPVGTGGSGAMISTLEDLHIWGKALGKGTLISKELHKKVLDSLKPIKFDPCPDTVEGREKTHCPVYDRYGMGMGEISGWIGHTGEFVGYSSLVMYDPKTDSTVVILMNVSIPKHHLPTELFQKYVPVLKGVL